MQFELPQSCFSVAPDTGSLICIKRGERGYCPSDWNTDDAERNRKIADSLNQQMGISYAVECAFIAGSILNWNIPHANPQHFLDYAEYQESRLIQGHISQYATELEMEGNIVKPEFPKEGDICDSYEIYQREGADLFRSYAEVAKQIHFTDYKRVYAGVLASEVNMEFLFTKHNQDNRPFRYKMRSMSIGDILVLKRNGQKRAFYVDSVSFTEIPKFLRDREPKKKARDRER